MKIPSYLKQRALSLTGVFALMGTSWAVEQVWTGSGADTNWSNSANWASGPNFGASNWVDFATYASGTANRLVNVNSGQALGAFVFGPETSGPGNAISIVGSASAIALSGVTGSTLGLSGSLATANVGLWIQSGAGANGIYANVGGSASKALVGTPIDIANAVTFVNDSGNDFYLNAILRGGGSVTLQNGSWVIDYSSLSGTSAISGVDNRYSNLSGGLTIENATLNVNVAGGTLGDNARSPLGQGAVTLGLAGSSGDAKLIFTSIDRAGTNTDNRLTSASGNNVTISDGPGKRIIENGSTTDKQLYSRVQIQGNATLTLDNSNIAGAVFTISAQTGNSEGVSGVSDSGDLNTGLRGTGNLYLTGGGTFLTRAGLSVPANGVRNSFTGTTTVHEGTLQFRVDGGFQATSRIQIDKDGILDVSAATGGTYTLGAYSFGGQDYSQTLAGTGQVLGTLVLGDFSTLRPGGTDSETFRAALNFDSALALGPLTIIDLSADYYGAADTAGLLSYAGELRLTLAEGYAADGSYDLFGFLSQDGNFSSVTVYEGAVLVGSFTQGVGPSSGSWYGSLSGQDYQLDLSSGALSVVPEPATGALLALAAGLILWRRRRAASPNTV